MKTHFASFLVASAALVAGPALLVGCASNAAPPVSPQVASYAALRSAATALDPTGRLITTYASPASSSRNGTARTWFEAAGALPKEQLYVANWYGPGVEVYAQGKNHRQTGFINTSPYQPNSVHVDRSGDVWVVLNTAGSGPSIEVFHPGDSSPYRLLSGVEHIPVSVAIARNGTAYVTDENEGTAELEVFAPGSNTPTSVLNDPAGTCCGWVAVDGHGNVFFTSESQTGHTGLVDEFVGGTGSPKSLGITLGTFPGGIEVLPNGTLVIVEQGIPSLGLAAKIDTFPKGSTTPSSVITGNVNCDNWVGPGLNVNHTKVYAGSTLQASPICGLNGTFGAIEEFAYPGGSPLSTFDTGLTNQGGWTLLVPATNPPPPGQ